MRGSSPADETPLQLPEFAAVPGGRTLEELLRSGTPLEPGEVARIGPEICRALKLAQAAGRRRSDTLLFAAPETLRGEAGTEQSDVYSAGVVLYRLLTGAFPVSAEAARQGRHLEAWTVRGDLRGAGSPVPLPLAHVVERAIDPRPEARHATLAALAADLEAAARQVHVQNRPLRRRFRQGAALAAVLALAALAWVVARAPLDQPVVAVRFEHHGGSMDAGAIVDGMTIEMTRLLAPAEGLEVRAALPSSSDRYAPRDALAFGSQRLASFVVSGSVHGQPGNWSHVEASLVRIRDRKVLWADSFSVVGGDIFAVQDRIAEAVVGALQMPFGPGRRRYSTTPPLQELFLGARALQAAGHETGRQAAQAAFERVAGQAPEFVPAFAALATTRGGVRPASHDLPAHDPGLAEAARTAHAKDPHLAEANAAMGLLSAGLCQWSEGKTYFRHALERDPSATGAYIDYAIAILLPLGDTRDAIDVLTDALEVDPGSLRVRRALAAVLVEHGDYDRAIEMSRGVLQESPELEATEQAMGRALYLSRRAGAEFQGEGHWGYRGYILARQGRDAEARLLAEAHPDQPARQMLIYAGLDDVEAAFDALQRTARLSPWRALTWMARPEIEPVFRDDPRAKALRAQLLGPAACGAGLGAPGTAAGRSHAP